MYDHINIISLILMLISFTYFRKEINIVNFMKFIFVLLIHIELMIVNDKSFVFYQYGLTVIALLCLEFTEIRKQKNLKLIHSELLFLCLLELIFISKALNLPVTFVTFVVEFFILLLSIFILFNFRKYSIKTPYLIGLMVMAFADFVNYLA